MRIPPKSTNPVHQSDSISRGSVVQKKQFENPVSSNKPVQSAAKTTPAADIMADVKLIADQVKSGTLSKEEATKQFAAVVMEKRHDLRDLGKSAEQVKEAIKNIVGDDPRFVSKLNAQLQQLAKA